MIKVNKMDRVILNLSQEHDNDANGIQFDISEWVQKFGPGTITLTHRRKGDKIPYPVNLQVDGSVVTWIISDVDTAVKGYGTAQLMYQPEGTDILAQSAVCKTLTMKSNYEIGSTPDPYDNWMSELTALAGETKVNADHAKQYADNTAASEQATAEMREDVSRDKAEIESKIAVAEHDIDAKMGSIQRYIEEEKAGLDETIETAERSIEASVNTATQEAEAATAAKNAAEKKATEVNQYVDTAKQQAAESKRQAETAATEATKAATSEAAAKTAAQEALGSKNTAANLVQGFDARVSSAKTDIENKGKEVIATIPENYSALVGEVSNVKKDLQSVESALDTRALKTDLDIANRKIDALEAVTLGKDWIWQESEDVAYSKDVPKGAVRMGINKIGGKSLVLNQIIDVKNFFKIPKSQNGITLQYVKDNMLTVSGTKTGFVNIGINDKSYDVEPNCKYLFVVNSSDPNVSVNFNEYNVNVWVTDRITSSAMIFTAKPNTNSAQLSLRVNTESEVNCTIEVMAFKLSGTGLDDITSYDEFKAIFPNHYYPFGATIISSQTDALEVRGKNLFDESLLIEQRFVRRDGYYFVDLPDKVYEKVVAQEFDSGSIRISYDVYHEDASRQGARLKVFYTDGSSEVPSVAAYNTWYTCNYVTKSNKTVKRIAWDYGSNIPSRIKNVMITKDLTGDYKPYSLDTIPTNLPVLRSAGEAYDYIETDVTFPNMKAVDLGSLNWKWYPAWNCWETTSITDFVNPSNGSVALNAITKDIPKLTAVEASTNLSVIGVWASASNKTIWFRNGSSTEKPSGILHYEATEGGEDYTTNVKHQSISERTLNGNEYWDIYRAGGINQVYVGDMNGIIKTSKDGRVNTLCAKFKSISIDNRELNYDTIYSGNLGICFNIKDITLEEWVAKLRSAPLTVYYELANERITEVELPPELEAIRVESGGAVTFRNADDNYHIPIPNKETFMVKVEEAI